MKRITYISIQLLQLLLRTVTDRARSVERCCEQVQHLLLHLVGTIQRRNEWFSLCCCGCAEVNETVRAANLRFVDAPSFSGPTRFLLLAAAPN